MGGANRLIRRQEPPMPLRCADPDCRHANLAAARYCARCGRALSAYAMIPPHRPAESSPGNPIAATGWFVVCVLALMVGTWLIFIGGGPPLVGLLLILFCCTTISVREPR